MVAVTEYGVSSVSNLVVSKVPVVPIMTVDFCVIASLESVVPLVSSIDVASVEMVFMFVVEAAESLFSSVVVSKGPANVVVDCWVIVPVDCMVTTFVACWVTVGEFVVAVTE